MKTELYKISQDLEQGNITDKEARTLLLCLLSINDSLINNELEWLEDNVCVDFLGTGSNWKAAEKKEKNGVIDSIM